MLYEAATAFAGGLYGIDPFDQPGVELGKRLAFGLLGREGYEAAAKEIRDRASHTALRIGSDTVEASDSWVSAQKNAFGPRARSASCSRPAPWRAVARSGR